VRSERDNPKRPRPHAASKAPQARDGSENKTNQPIKSNGQGGGSGKHEAGPLVACLLSHHELALSELQGWLSRSGFELHAVLIESAPAGDLRRLVVPQAQVYIVDSQAPPQAVENLVGGLLERFPPARILAMAKQFTEANAFPILRLGVKGLVEYGAGPQDLPRAVLHISTGAFWVPRDLLSKFVDQILAGQSQASPLETAGRISPREQQVLDALLKNLSNKEIGSALNISERTAKFHVSNLLEKFGVQRRADLILLRHQAHGTDRWLPESVRVG
jgi:DNA-binding NarL/FixJ family response regulator